MVRFCCIKCQFCKSAKNFPQNLYVSTLFCFCIDQLGDLQGLMVQHHKYHLLIYWSSPESLETKHSAAVRHILMHPNNESNYITDINNAHWSSPNYDDAILKWKCWMPWNMWWHKVIENLQICWLNWLILWAIMLC